MRPDERPDARRVARFRDNVLVVIRARSAADEIWITDAVSLHYRLHADQFDVRIAEALLPEVVADPWAIYQGKKQSTLVFVEAFDADRYLVVPIKLLPAEAWIETLYVTNKQPFHRRGWALSGLIYVREE